MMSSRFCRRFSKAPIPAEAFELPTAELALRATAALLVAGAFLAIARDDFFAPIADDLLAAALADFLRAAGEDFLEICLPALAGLRCAFFMPQNPSARPGLSTAGGASYGVGR